MNLQTFIIHKLRISHNTEFQRISEILENCYKHSLFSKDNKKKRDMIRMEIKKENVYLVIGIIGLVFTFLSFFTHGMDSGLTIGFLFTFLLLCMKLYEEYKYYRSYKAPLASGIFLLIPSAIALAGGYIARIATVNGDPFLNELLIQINLDFSFFTFDRIFIFTNFFSLVFVIPFFVILSILFYRYYYGIYPRLFLLRKKFFKQFAMYYNIGMLIIIVMTWNIFGTILVIELVFLVVSIFFIFQTYVLKVILVPVKIAPRRSGTRSRTVRPTNQRTPTRTTANSPSRPRSTSSPTRTSNPSRSLLTPSIPVLSASSQNQTMATPQARSPSRQQPNRTPTRSQTRPQRSRSTNSDIQVVDAIPVARDKSKQVASLDKNTIKALLPVGSSLTKDDFRCIFCYELPTESNDQIVICPNCRKPAHYKEYRQWNTSSSLCSYCNKDITTSPKRISGSQYAKIIKIGIKS